MQKTGLKRYIRYLGLIILPIIIIKVNPVRLWNTIAQVKPGLVAAALLFTFPYLFTKSLRWALLLKIQNYKFPKLKAYLAYFVGNFWGSFTPGRLGDMIRILYVYQQCNISRAQAASSTLIDRLMDIAMLCIVGAIGIIPMMLGPRLTYAVLMLFIILVFVFVIIFHKNLFENLCHYIVRYIAPEKIARAISTNITEFLDSVEKLKSFKLILPCGLTFVAYAIYFSQVYVLALALNIKPGYLYLAVCVAVANIVSWLPLTISGMGTRDAVFLTLFSLKHIPGEKAVGLSLLFLLIVNFWPALLGAVVWYKMPVSMEKHR